MELQRATWQEIATTETDLAVVPVGSTEQHGPHAPLGTDAISAQEIASRAAEASTKEVIVAPTISVGIAEEHRQFPGTMWVSEETFRQYVSEATKSLFEHGLNRVVLVNGHGGNTAALREVGGRLTRHTQGYVVPFTWFEAVDNVEMGHGGPLETAVIRHLAPELIREDQLDAAADGASDGWGEWCHGVNLAYDSAEFTDSGVVGDPRATNAEDGAAIVDAVVEALVDVLQAVAARSLSEPARRE